MSTLAPDYPDIERYEGEYIPWDLSHIPPLIKDETSELLAAHSSHIAESFERVKCDPDRELGIDDFPAVMRDYNLARGFRGGVINAVGLAAGAIAAENIVDEEWSRAEPHGVDTTAAIMQMLGQQSETDRFEPWFIRNLDMTTGYSHRAFNQATNIAFMGGSESLSYAPFAAAVQTISWIRMREILDHNGLPQSKIDDIRYDPGLSYVEASDVLLDEIEGILGYKAPPRIMQHDNWREPTGPVELYCNPDAAVSNIIGDRVDNALSLSRLYLGYYASARYQGLDQETAFESLVQHGASFAGEEAKTVSHKVRFLMRDRGLPHMVMSQAILLENTALDMQQTDIDTTTNRIIFPEVQRRAGRCAGVLPARTQSYWIDGSFKNLLEVYNLDYGVEPEITDNNALSLYALGYFRMLNHPRELDARIAEYEEFYEKVMSQDIAG